MKVYIVRHGKAERESETRRDADRILTARGVEQARYIGDQIARGPARPSLILTSAAVRAFETARLIHSYLDCRIDVAEQLLVDEPVSAAVDLLTRLAFPAAGPPISTVMLVGHNPQVSELCEVLLSGVGASTLSFRTGEAVLLELNRATLIGSGRLVSQIRLHEQCQAGA